VLRASSYPVVGISVARVQKTATFGSFLETVCLGFFAFARRAILCLPPFPLPDHGPSLLLRHHVPAL
jgi:hypothetical protein